MHSMQRVSLLILCYLLGQLINGQNNIVFSELEKEALNKPDSILALLNEKKKFDQISKAEYTYLKIVSSEELGLHNNVDSLINYGFNYYDFSNDSTLYLKYYLILANQYKVANKLGEALQHLNYVIEVASRIEDTLTLANAYISLGELYRATEYFKSGLYNLDKAESLLNSFSDNETERALARLYGRRSAILMQAKLYPDSVKILSLRALLLASKIGDINLQASSLNELGCLYTQQNNDKAEPYLKQAIELWEEIGYIAYSTNARLNLARYYLKKEKFEKGITVLLENIKVVENSNWKLSKGEYYNLLGELYTGIEDFEKASTYIIKAKDTLLSVNETQYNEQLALIDTELEVQRKEEELYRQKTEIEKARLEAIAQQEENKILYYIIATVLLIALITLSFLYFINKQNRRLKSQKIEIERINEDFSNLVDQKQALLREVNHRVKNNLSILSSLLYLQQRKLKNKEAIQALKSSLVRINTISLIHESLYNRDDMEKVDFQDYLIKLTGYIKSIYWQEEKELSITIDCNDYKPELSVSVPLAMIINELITNSFKYAFQNVEEPIIKIAFKHNSITFYDNGPGIKKKKKKKYSLGLKLVEVFAQQIDATIVSEKKETSYSYVIHLAE